MSRRITRSATLRPWRRLVLTVRIAGWVVLTTLLALSLGVVRAEELPIRRYTIADGLPIDDVARIVLDRQGFLWFLTRKGICRYDGRFFTTLGPQHGLPEDPPTDLLITSSGRLLVAAGGGLYTVDPSRPQGERPFLPLRPEGAAESGGVAVLLEDRAGRLWCGARNGLYRLEQTATGWSLREVNLGGEATGGTGGRVTAIMEDRSGALWIGRPDGVIRRSESGHLRRLTKQEGFQIGYVNDLVEDDKGRIWVGIAAGVGVITRRPGTDFSFALRIIGGADGLIDDFDASQSGPEAEDLCKGSDGKIWIATLDGLVEVLAYDPPGKVEFRTHRAGSGLAASRINCVAEDGARNIWLGSYGAGVFELTRNGFSTFGARDGLGGNGVIGAIFQDRLGRLCVVSGHGNAYLNFFDGRRFTAVRPRIPERIQDRGWGWGQIVLQDRRGGWWFSTFQGICRFAPTDSLEELARSRPVKVYTARDGLLDEQVFRIYESSRGEIWAGTIGEGSRWWLYRWNAAADRFEAFGKEQGVPADIPVGFVEDGARQLWIAFYHGALGRFRGGRFQQFTAEDLADAGFIDQLYRDGRGRLWVATNRDGLVRVDDPESERPAFHRMTTADGLSSDLVRAIAEDSWGRLYLGTDRGVDRLDPASGRVEHYSTRDGLPANMVPFAYSDHHGTLWFGSHLGLARLVPSAPRSQRAPPVWIRGLTAGGTPRAEFPLGATELSPILLGPDQRQLEIEYSSRSYAAGENLRFQYRLGGSSKAWQAPTADRKVNFVNLAPGRYRFEVRAVNSEGLVSPEPARVSIRVLRPFWQRWWFVSLNVAFLALAAYAAHRLRLRRLLQLERVRTRIATDLHDDIGSSLSQVSILSEVVRQKVEAGESPAAVPLLEEIAGIARDLVDSMSDIVWAINPKRDRAADLAQRMRRFASDTFLGRNIRLHFEVPPEYRDRRLEIETRRQVFLIFKEAIHNAARHSGCSEVRIDFDFDERELLLCVSDNGRGFDQQRDSQGHGLDSMRARAEGLGGELVLESREGQGTAVRLTVPIGGKGSWFERLLRGGR